MKTTYRRTIASVFVILSLGTALLSTITTAHAAERVSGNVIERGHHGR